MPKQIVVADDHPLFRSAISSLLISLHKNGASANANDIKVAEVEDFSSLIELLKSSHSTVSLILLDLKLPDIKGIEGLLFLKKNYPSLPVVIVSAYDEDKIIHNAMQYGASGFIPKNLEMPIIANAISDILAGNVWYPQISTSDSHITNDFKELTCTQLKVLSLLKEGLLNKEMASSMNVTEATIKAHLTEIFRKLNVSNRTQAVLLAKELDLPDSNLEH
ncbi:MAG: response regulator transcription factor [Gammaproteobacteria bacterium]|nr:response regulator transcription factor [Gammaproteobacteria bacterium]